jgi:hypothetical protein
MRREGAAGRLALARAASARAGALVRDMRARRAIDVAASVAMIGLGV